MSEAGETRDVPDVSNIMYCVSKLFASGGEHASYYLNTYRSFKRWADDNGLTDGIEKLPPIKGSRQSVNVEIPAAILHNLPSYLKYMSEISADSDPNNLVDIAFSGLKDKYVVAAMRARTFIGATFLLPMRLFTHHNDVARPHIHSIMECAEKWIKEDLAAIGDTPPLISKLPDLITSNNPDLLQWYVRL